MASMNHSSKDNILPSGSTTTWSDYFDTQFYPAFFPFLDPVGAYHTVISSMGIFSKTFTAEDIPDLSGKVYFVTGGKVVVYDPINVLMIIGNIGLGKETILQLVKHKASHIYLGARNQSKAEDAIADIKKDVPDAQITWIPLDLANLDSIANAAKIFQEKSNRLDVLVNNAGVMNLPNGKTSDGFEIQFGTNHIGPFYLTKLLLPTLQATVKETGDVRIVNLSSEAHHFVRITGLHLKHDSMQSLGSWRAYGNSKFANILFAREIAKRYPDITSVSIHPGIILGTGLYSATQNRSFLYRLGIYAGSFILPDVPTGSLNQIWAATTAKSNLKNGGYYTPIGKLSNGNSTVSDTSRDTELWDWTEEQLKSKGH